MWTDTCWAECLRGIQCFAHVLQDPVGSLFRALSSQSSCPANSSLLCSPDSQLPLYNSESWPGSIFTAPWSGISLKAVNQGSCKTHLVYYFPLFPNAQYLGNCCLIYFVGFFCCCCCCFRQEGKSGPWTMPWPEAEVLWIQVCYHFWWRQDPDMPSLTINMGEKNKI